ncbi:MAG: TlpA family protein disulfide reductase [Mucilaginibacter sp.]|nr:TlpA family protein disulfide reductase [Mucilaginibacter sp.]
MKLKICFLLFLCSNFGVMAQVKGGADAEVGTMVSDGLLPLKVGDAVPDIALAKVLNGKGALRLGGFKGKLLILDFWATSCGSCIQAMPRLDSLQRLFADRLVILPVTAEKAESIRYFQKHNAFLKGSKFISVVEDKALHQLFPHRLLPHEVWISAAGKVLGFTEVTEVTEERIRSVLAGDSLSAPLKKDVLDFDPAKPLLVRGNGAPDTNYRYRSLITAEIKGLPSAVSVRVDSLHQRTVIMATNVTLRKLYELAYKPLRNIPDSMVVLGDQGALWCYELDLPVGGGAGNIRQWIRQDLDRFFKVRSEWSGDSFRLVPLPDRSAADEPFTL